MHMGPKRREWFDCHLRHYFVEFMASNSPRTKLRPISFAVICSEVIERCSAVNIVILPSRSISYGCRLRAPYQCTTGTPGPIHCDLLVVATIRAPVGSSTIR